MVAQGLASHCSRDAVVVWASKNVCALVAGAGTVTGRCACQDKFAALYVAESLVVRAVGERLGCISNPALRWALRALGNFARRHEQNRRRLLLLGLPDLLLQLRPRLGIGPCRTKSEQHQDQRQEEQGQQEHVQPIEHERDAKLIESLCWLIGNCSYPDADAQAQLERGAACEIVVSSMEAYAGACGGGGGGEIIKGTAAGAALDAISGAKAMQEALRALRNLCCEHQRNQQRCFELGAAQICMHVCQRCTQAGMFQVLQWVW